LRAVEREAQEVDGLPLCASTARVRLGKSTECDELGLGRLQFQVEPRQAFAQRVLDPKSILPILETQHKVIDVPHQVPGTGKLKIAGGVEGSTRESINRAFAYLMGQKVKMGVGQQIDTTDFHVEAIDLLSNHVSCDAGIALLVAVYSAIKRQSVQAGLVILGDLSIQGNIKSVRSLAEPLQVAMDNGARRALVPLENKRNFLEVSGEIVERVDPVFFSDPMTAAMKALGMTEGIVVKKLDDAYDAGGTKWWKILNRSYSQKEGRGGVVRTEDQLNTRISWVAAGRRTSTTCHWFTFISL
jgi:Lon protease (S16) C-terminal proteolytic domain